MQVSPLIEHLQGPVRFVLRDSAQPLSPGCFQQYRTVSGCSLRFGIQNRFANFPEPAGCTEVREIGAEVTALAQDHVTSGTTCLAKDGLPRGRVARNRYAD